MRARLTLQRGQAMVESLLVFPLLLISLLLIVQLIWLALAQASVEVATHYSVRAGALNHGSQEAITKTLIAGMASLIPQRFEQLPPSRAQQWQAQFAATAKQWAHFQWAGKLQIHRPTATVIQEQAEHRYDLRTGRMVDELAVDHAAVRLAAAPDPAQWQADRTLDIEVWWCLPLRVPLASVLLSKLKNARASAAQQFCQTRQKITGQVLWALEYRATHRLESGYRTVL